MSIGTHFEWTPSRKGCRLMTTAKKCYFFLLYFPLSSTCSRSLMLTLSHDFCLLLVVLLVRRSRTMAIHIKWKSFKNRVCQKTFIHSCVHSQFVAAVSAPSSPSCSSRAVTGHDLFQLQLTDWHVQGLAAERPEVRKPWIYAIAVWL